MANFHRSIMLHFFKKINFISRFLYNMINWYVGRFRFPHRGWKYFRSFLQFFDLDKETYKKKLYSGLYINVRPVDHIQKDLFWYGHYELDAISIWSHLIQKDSVVIDIGANIGYYTIAASSKATLGHAYAFEPVSFLRNEIEKNIQLNHLNNVTICSYALRDQEQDANVYVSSIDNVGMSGLLPAENFSGRIEAVTTISLDKWLKDQGMEKADIIKMDVEGAELQILLGMKNTLTTFRPAILVEVIESQLTRFGGSVEKLYAFLRFYNYNPYDIIGQCTLKPIYHNKEDYTILFYPAELEFPNDINIIYS